MDTVEIQRNRVSPARVQVEPAGTPATGPVREVSQQYTETRVSDSGRRRAVQAIWLVVGVMDVILAFDFLFRSLRGANTGFASFIYGLGGALGAPFDGIFGETISNSGNGTIGIIRWGDLMAIAVYTLVASALVQLVRIATDSRNSVSKNSTTVM